MSQEQGSRNSHTTVIPPAVRRAAEAAEKLQRDLIEGQKPNGAAPEPPAAPPPPPEPPQATAAQETPPAPPEPPAEGKPPAPTHPDPAAQPPEDPNSETFKSRFESEQGRLRKAREDLQAVAQENANLRRLLATTQPTAPAAPAEVSSLITPEEETEWGPDLLKVIGKKAEEIAQRAVSKLQSEVDALKGQVKATGEATVEDARERMKQMLNTHPDIGQSSGNNWLELNNHPAFHDWLMQIDPLSGGRRQDMLVEAWNTNSASRVAAFFTKFLQENGVVAPQQGSSKQPVPPAAPKPNLEDFAAPGPLRSAAPSLGAADKEIIPRTDITRFYADKAAGRWRGREKEADDYEKRIFAAQNEGRLS